MGRSYEGFSGYNGAPRLAGPGAVRRTWIAGGARNDSAYCQPRILTSSDSEHNADSQLQSAFLKSRPDSEQSTVCLLGPHTATENKKCHNPSSVCQQGGRLILTQRWVGA